MKKRRKGEEGKGFSVAKLHDGQGDYASSFSPDAARNEEEEGDLS